VTRTRNETGGVIVGYFAKIIVVLGVFAVFAFDAVSVGVAKMNVQDVATEAAQAGAESWTQYHNRTSAFRAVAEVAAEHGTTVVTKSFRITEDGTVYVSLEKDAATMLLYRTSRTKTWAHVSATGHGRAV
jgi:Flp pilus assembly protein TadG